MSPTTPESIFANAMFGAHPVFSEAYSRIIAVLGVEPPTTIDDLIVRSRTPIRTALLVVNDLLHAGEIYACDGQLFMASQTGNLSRPQPQPTPSAIATLNNREAPCLIWGQRRLVTASATERATYIASVARDAPIGSIVFLGDDDLVSPMVAAKCQRPVFVIDIDSLVLKAVEEDARDAGTNITTIHADLSHDRSPIAELEAAIVVCDPYPSGDGSFEVVFWSKAASILQASGLLISTVAPSHKPERYAQGSLDMLNRLGFQVLELKANFGHYEIFDFELTEFERAILAAVGGRCSISHTKSLFTARHIGGRPQDEVARIDFRKWEEAATSHYLTAQAGLAEQITLAKDRGPAGLQRTTAAAAAPKVLTGSLNELGLELGRKYGIDIPPQVQHALSDPNLPSTYLGLVLRAIESWDRWRLDDQ